MPKLNNTKNNSGNYLLNILGEKMKKAKINLIYFLIAMGGFLLGYLTSVIAGVLPLMSSEFKLNSQQQGLTSSIVIFGGVLGALSFGKLAEKIGRKKTFLGFVFLCTLSIIGCSLPRNFTIIMGFRFLMGISVGAIQGLVPIYLSEIAPTPIRGKISSFATVLTNGGFLVAYIVNYLFYSSQNWRIMNLICLISTFLILLGGFKIPETPEWLLKNNQVTAAQKNHLLIFGTKLTVTSNDATSKKTLHGKKIEHWMITPLILCIFIVTFQKFTGANTILYYAPKILKSAHLPEKLASLSTIGIGIILVLAAIISQNIVDKVGRKFLALLGNALMGGILILLSILTKIPQVPVFITIIFLFCFIAVYALTWSSIPWILMGELLPNAIKDFGSALATGGTWLADALITLFFPDTLKAVGISSIFLFFGILNIICWFLLNKNLFETKGKSSDEIAMIEKNNN